MATVAQIEEMLQNAGRVEFDALERSLSGDTRKGVAAALKVARARLAREEAETRRLEGLYAFDRDICQERLGSTASMSGEPDEGDADGPCSKGAGIVVGLDEVGRGAVAGPLAVGAVVLRGDARVPGLNDSKQLTPEQRETVAAGIKASALAWSVEFVDPRDIDRDGMSASLRRAFSGALAKVEERGVRADVVLVDGNPLGIDPREVNVVKGDAKSASIAAASVVAKVTRDEYMREQSPLYPPYVFHENKGYASAEHQQAIHEHGLTPLHRASFCKGFLQETLF